MLICMQSTSVRIDAATHDELKRLALLRFGYAFGRFEVENRCLAGSHGDTLVGSRQVAASPRDGAAFQPAARIRQNHEGRHVLILRTESVCDPASETWTAHQNTSGIHLIDGLRMIHAVSM